MKWILSYRSPVKLVHVSVETVASIGFIKNMCSKKIKIGICQAEDSCYDGHLCHFCLTYGHKKVFTDAEEVMIDRFMEDNRELMDKLAEND